MNSERPRLVIEPEDRAALERIAQVTRCGSLSTALSLLVSRCADAFIDSWKVSSGASYLPQQMPAAPSQSPSFQVASVPPDKGENLAPLDF